MLSRTKRSFNWAFIVSALVALTVLAGCSQPEPPTPPTPQETFANFVAEGDAAWEFGDAEKAFELYTSALKTDGATDADGAVKAKQELAKNLTLARRILASNAPSPNAIDPYVQVLMYVSAESTEGVAGRASLAECFVPFANGLRSDIVTMRKAINANASVKSSANAHMINSLGQQWTSQVSEAPEPTSGHLKTALKELQRAAALVDKAFDRTYAEDALTDLAAADKAITAAEKSFDAAAK